MLPSKMWRNSLASRLQLSRASSKTNPRLVMKQKRVRKAMVELDYHPNLNARSLVSQSSQVIALVLPIDSDVLPESFLPNCFKRITQIASDNDYAIQICTGQNEERRLDNLKQLIYGNRVDGLIFLYSNPNDPSLNLRSKTSSLPHSRKGSFTFCIASG